MTQVHKETLTQVENALPNRQGLDYEIFGMEGVPDDVLQSHNQRVLQQYYEQQAERQAATGNPPPGAAGGTTASGQPKKPKLEDKESLKARLAAHKAKKAQEAAGGSSGDVTPLGQSGQSPAMAQSPVAFVSVLQVTFCRGQDLTGFRLAAERSAVSVPADFPDQPYASAICSALRSACLFPAADIPSTAWLWCPTL